MAKACCVDGCLAKDDIHFRFPNSRTLCKKWMDAVKLSTKPGHNSVLCRAHFKPDDYSLVRGKVRLKPKVIPSSLKNEQFKTNKTHQNILTDSEKDENESVEGRAPQEEDRLQHNKELNKIVADKNPNNKDDNIDKRESMENTKYSLKKNKENGKVRKSSRSRGKRKSKIEETKGLTNKKKRKVKSPEGVTQTIKPSAEELPEREDIEEFLTYFHIRQNKSVADRQNAELEREKMQNGGGDESHVEVIDLAEQETEAKPVFIEISIDKDSHNGRRRGSARDCLMVVESVQVELDPNDLLLPEPEDQNVGDEPIVVDDKAEEAISLLTSSDEDDVILQEPHIDTVVVSDESACGPSPEPRASGGGERAHPHRQRPRRRAQRRKKRRSVL